MSSYIRTESDEENVKCLVSISWTIVGLAAGATTAAIKTCKNHRSFTKKKIISGSKLPRQVIQTPTEGHSGKIRNFCSPPQRNLLMKEKKSVFKNEHHQPAQSNTVVVSSQSAQQTLGTSQI